MNRESVDAWFRTPISSRWRRSARLTIANVYARMPIDANDAEILAAVDAAYPFGERKCHPYKAWLIERRLFRTALAYACILPTQDEIDACEVARDLVLDGKPALAQQLLDAQAPHRLARACPRCGAWPNRPCHEARQPNVIDIADDLLVPHHARLVGHNNAGPLFTRFA